MIKKILVAIFGLIVLLVIGLAVLTFMTPTSFKFGREIVINKPRADVFNYVKLIKNQSDWGPWIRRDKDIVLNYKGTDGEKGFTVIWDSKVEEVGAGEQEIKSITDSKIDTELRFKRPMETTNYSSIVLEEVSPTQTKVRWDLSGEMPRPMNLMLRFIDIDAAVGKDFEDGLASLKSIVEKQ